jgi:hypothetical protein
MDQPLGKNNLKLFYKPVGVVLSQRLTTKKQKK